MTFLKFYTGSVSWFHDMDPEVDLGGSETLQQTNENLFENF